MDGFEKYFSEWKKKQPLKTTLNKIELIYDFIYMAF